VWVVDKTSFKSGDVNELLLKAKLL